MRKRLYILSIFCVLFLCARAETILLRTGARVKGTIVFENEEVVIIRESVSGSRYQYPRADVEAVLRDDESGDEPVEAESAAAEQEMQVSKKASILLELAGGMAYLPSHSPGGGVSADLLVGSHHIGERHIFVGGGIGYHGAFLTGERYNFLPIQAALRMPLTEQKHAPYFGISAGYGIALSNDYLGGIYAGLDFGYRCQLNPKTAIGLCAYAQFQQATLRVAEVVEGTTFSNSTGRNIVCAGLKVGLYF